MKKLLLLLALSLPSHAAIAYVTSGTNCGGVNSPVPATVTITASHTAIIVTFASPSTIAVTSITGGGTYTKRASTTSGTYTIEIWATAAGASASASSVSVAFSGGPATNFGLIAADYSGVVALGNTNTNSNTNANPTISVTTQDLNNFVVAGFAVTAGTPTSGTGTLRNSTTGCGSPASAFNDNTVTSPGALVNTVTHTAATWVAVALELRTLVAPNAQRRR